MLRVLLYSLIWFARHAKAPSHCTTVLLRRKTNRGGGGDTLSTHRQLPVEQELNATLLLDIVRHCRWFEVLL
jgi:hypothetical protein